MKFINITFLLAAILVLFQNCSDSLTFQAKDTDSIPNSSFDLDNTEPYNADDNTETNPKIHFYQSGVESEQINPQDTFYAKIAFRRNYQSPALCFTAAQDKDTCQNLHNYTDLSNFNSGAITKKGDTSEIVLNDFSSVIKNIFQQKQLPLEISVFFISEHHNEPLKIGNLKITSPSATPVFSSCGATPRSVKILDWIQYKLCGIPVETQTIKLGNIQSYKFKADKSFYPRGTSITFETTVYSGGSNRVDISISPCAGDFESSQARCIFKRVKIFSIHTSFGPQYSTNCILEDGKEYYLNIRTNELHGEAAKIFGTQRH